MPSPNKEREMSNAILNAVEYVVNEANAAEDVGDERAYQLDSRPLAFALPLSHTDVWRVLGALVLESTSVLPGDSRWGRR